MGNDCPCKGCIEPKRHVGCHDKCNEYKEWKATEQVKKDAERKRKEADDAILASYRPRRR